MIDTDSIAEVYSSSHVVSPVDIVDLTASDERARSELCREVIAFNVVNMRHLRPIVSFRTDIGLPTTTIDIINVDFGCFRRRTDIQQ